MIDAEIRVLERDIERLKYYGGQRASALIAQMTTELLRLKEGGYDSMDKRKAQGPAGHQRAT